MAGSRRRTAFAAPLVLVLASGCRDDRRTRTSNPPEPAARPNPYPATFRGVWDVRRVGPGACSAEPAIDRSPARASECPPGTSGKTTLRVAELEPGRCAIVPPGCVTGQCLGVAAPCPLPAGARLPERFVEVWVVEKNKNGDGGCHAEEPEGTCPPGVDCNPPVPRKVACPPGATDTEEVRVALLPDHSCAVAPDDCHTPACVGASTPCPDR